MVAPTILAHAVEDVRRQYLAPMYRGDVVACQLFSEPVAGSDLAGIQTKAAPRRRRVDPQRPEGVDVGRPLLRHRRDHHPDDHLPRQPPPGPDDVPGRHAGPRRGGAAPAPDDRRRLVQRGVLHRRAGPRRDAPGRRRPGLDGGAHHAHERAHGHRWRRRRRRPGPGRAPPGAGPPHGRGRRPPRAPAAGRRPHPALGQPLHDDAGHGQDAGRPAPGPGAVDAEAGPDQQHAEDLGAAHQRARAAPHRRHRRVGHLRLVRLRARRARACGWRAAPTRSCATSSARGCSACRRADGAADGARGGDPPAADGPQLRGPARSARRPGADPRPRPPGAVGRPHTGISLPRTRRAGAGGAVLGLHLPGRPAGRRSGGRACSGRR